MGKWILSIVFVLLITEVWSQSVSGTITDDHTGEGLLFVNVIGPNNRGTVSDENGKYHLDLPTGESKIVVSFIGYNSQTYTLSLKENEDYSLDIQLIEQTKTLETVVLTSGKFEQKIEETTVSLEVIKPSLVQEKNTVSLQDAFNQTPGVNINDDQANIRSGSGWSFGAGSRVLMMVDDMPMMSPDAGQVQWKLLPQEAIYQMEVIKGASSALYGTSALNGLINVRTAIPTTEPRTEVSAFYGFYDSPKRPETKWWTGTQSYSGLTFMHARKIKKSEIVVSGTFLDDQGFRWKENDQRARVNIKTQFYPTSVKGLTWGVNAGALYSKSGDAMLWQDYENNPYVAYGNDITLSSGWDYYVDPNISYHKGRAKHTLKTRFLGINNNAKSSTTNYENFSKYLYSEYQFQYFFERHLTLTAGSVFALANSNSEVFQGVHNTQNFAAFAQLDRKWDRLNASIGMRYESYTVDNRNFSRPVLRAGLNYQMARATFVRVSYGGGYRYPSMAELFTNTNVGAINVFPNEELEAESGWTSEIGIKQGFRVSDSWKGFFDLSGFINHYNNMTEFTFGLWDNGFGTNMFGFRSINVGPTRITGIESTISTLGKIGEVDLRILTGYAYMNPIALEPDAIYAKTGNGFELSYTETSSDPTNGILKYRYQHLFKFDVQTEYKRIGVGLSIRYNDFMQNIDKIFESGIIAIAIPGVKESREANPNGDLIFDSRVYYNFSKGFQLSFIIDNLTNTEYTTRPAQLGAPRRFLMKASVKL